MVDLTQLDLTNFAAAGIGGAVWFYFLFLTPLIAKRAGHRHREPSMMLHAGWFKGVQWLTLPVFLYVGLAHHYRGYVPEDLPRDASALLYSLGAAGVIAGLWFGVLRGAEKFMASRDTGGGTDAAALLRALGVCLALGGVVLALPWVAAQAGFDVLDTLFDKGGTIHANAAAFAPVLLALALFWFVPAAVGARLRASDAPSVSTDYLALNFTRFWLYGFIIAAAAGVPGRFSELGPLWRTPVGVPFLMKIVAVVAVIHLLWWVVPLIYLELRAAEEDFIAEEEARSCRAIGAPALVRWISRSRRAAARRTSGEEHLCTTCLRPLDDITKYKNFDFAHCPHCGSYTPPVFTLKDYINHRAGQISPLFEDDPDGSAARAHKKQKARAGVRDTVVQDLARAIVALGVRERGTDIHLIPEAERFLVRCRTDGVLFTLVDFGKPMERPLISALKVLSNLDITERRKPQDGTFKLVIDGIDVDIRINTSPVGDAEMAAMRLLYQQGMIGSVEKLNLGRRLEDQYRGLLAQPHGLILVTGPTGSGKSTTLYNSLQEIATGERNIVTLEDPVEHKLPGLTQMQINPAKGFTFATGLRSILRQDPDVIMVGEIRDGETARMAVEAASTGHLVFSTLHANDSINAVTRLADLEIDIRRTADVLLLVLAQRLARLVCDSCGEEVEITAEELARRGLEGSPVEAFTGRRGRGCAHCHDSGYYGREGIFEFFAPDSDIKEMIGSRTSSVMIRTTARAMGMRSLLEHGLVKALTGRTTLDEVLRVTS